MGANIPKNDSTGKLSVSTDQNPYNMVEVNYKVREGDNLSKIALAAGVSVKELERCNNIKDPSKIQIGQILRLHYHPQQPYVNGDYSNPANGDAYLDVNSDYARATAARDRFVKVQEMGAQEYNKANNLKLKG